MYNSQSFFCILHNSENGGLRFTGIAMNFRKKICSLRWGNTNSQNNYMLPRISLWGRMHFYFRGGHACSFNT